MDVYRNVTNPGSALGEAIGASMEKALESLLRAFVDEYGYHYLTAGIRKTKFGAQAKKLLMFDSFGNDYNIDGVIANEAMQPLILFESKYIRYKKHNRDKGSWVCTAHTAVRRRYHSIRSSIAILAGSWSKSSVAMMKSHDIIIFLIPFDFICTTLLEYGVDFRWGEKEQDKAFLAWQRYTALPQADQAAVGHKMISLIEDKLLERIELILDDTVEREVEKVIIELVSNLGELKVFEFASTEEAMEFLNEEDLESVFIIGDSITLFDPPPQLD